MEKYKKFKNKAVVIDVILFVFITIASFAVGEAVLRKIDGYNVFSIQLINESKREPSADSDRLSAKVYEYAKTIKLAGGVDLDWFKADPIDENLNFSSDTVAEQNVQVYPEEFFRVWNPGYVNLNQSSKDYFAKLPSYTFLADVVDDNKDPYYRFLPSFRTPKGLKTNRYGWRSQDVDFVKKPRTIRIAFVGASTTVNSHEYPFSYPELIGNWLNMWAINSGLDVNFEIINLGREGIGSGLISKIVKMEAIPMQPDLVVYHEGSNQFDLTGMVSGAKSKVESLKKHSERSAWTNLLGYSAILNRVNTLFQKGASVTEGSVYEVVWPETVDEYSPSLDAKNLPANLSDILKDLRRINADINEIGSKLVLTSFNWSVWDGMHLDPESHRSIIDYIKYRIGPFKYKDIERVNNFQNRVLKNFAKSNGLDFIEFAEKYPRDLDLFIDPIHETYPGVRLRAWIILQQLVPILSNGIAKHQFPAKWNKKMSTVSLDPKYDNLRTVRLGYSDPASDDRYRFGLNLLDKIESDPSGNLKRIDEVVLVTPPAYYSYAARVKEKITVPVGASAVYRVVAQVESGEVEFAVFSKEENRFIAAQNIGRGDGYRTIVLPVPAIEVQDLGSFVVVNKTRGNLSSKVVIKSADVYFGHENHSVSGVTVCTGICFDRDAN